MSGACLPLSPAGMALLGRWEVMTCLSARGVSPAPSHVLTTAPSPEQSAGSPDTGPFLQTCRRNP